jgi:hypothetical protein
MNLILKDEIIEKNINKKTWKIKKKTNKKNADKTWEKNI